jgi:glycosyltransferase involved in cell wall biosynthesis
MSQDPLVSIIIPCHNAEPWLGATLESALGQTWRRFEVIVVDDGSSDGSAALARRFESRGVKVLQVVNGGAAVARNHGLRLASGDFVQYLDADDLLAPDKVAIQVECLLQTGPEAVATCSWARFAQSPADATFRVEDEVLWRDFSPAEWLIAAWRTHTMMATAAWLTPRTLIDRVGPWATEFGRNNSLDDMEYFARVVLASSVVRFCPAAKSYYRSGIQGSLSRRRGNDGWAAMYASVHLTADRLLAKTTSPEAKLAAATSLQHLIYESYPQVPEHRKAAEGRIRLLGGTDLRPEAGSRTRLLHRLIGWKATNRLKAWLSARR